MQIPMHSKHCLATLPTLLVVPIWYHPPLFKIKEFLICQTKHALSVTITEIWNSTKGEECNPQCSCFTSLYWMKLTLSLHSLHTQNVTNTSSVTFWMGCSKLEEHLWWIELNVLVLSSSEDWGVAPLSLVGTGCPCDRIRYFTDLAVPIDGCWCGHTCHRHDRQH